MIRIGFVFIFDLFQSFPKHTFYICWILHDATNIEIYDITDVRIIQSGDIITVECILFGGNPLGNIIWYKGIQMHK